MPEFSQLYNRITSRNNPYKNMKYSISQSPIVHASLEDFGLEEDKPFLVFVMRGSQNNTYKVYTEPDETLTIVDQWGKKYIGYPDSFMEKKEDLRGGGYRKKSRSHRKTYGKLKKKRRTMRRRRH